MTKNKGKIIREIITFYQKIQNIFSAEINFILHLDVAASKLTSKINIFYHTAEPFKM